MVEILKLITRSYDRYQKAWQDIWCSQISPPQGQGRWEKFLTMKLQQEINFLTKGESGGVSTMPKILMEVAQSCNIFNYRPPRPHNDVKFQYRTMVAGPEVDLASNFVFSGNSKEKVGK